VLYQSAAQRVSEVLEINLPYVRLRGSEADGGVQQQADKETLHDYEDSAVGARHQQLRAIDVISPFH
jgi:hypothetical protein